MYNRAIDQFISYCFEPHEVKTNKDYPNSIFWVKDGKIIVEIEKQQYFWLHYQIWADISKMFELDYDETQSVIKLWLEQHHNLGELTPSDYSIQKLLEGDTIIWGK